MPILVYQFWSLLSTHIRFTSKRQPLHWLNTCLLNPYSNFKSLWKSKQKKEYIFFQRTYLHCKTNVGLKLTVTTQQHWPLHCPAPRKWLTPPYGPGCFPPSSPTLLSFQTIQDYSDLHPGLLLYVSINWPAAVQTAVFHSIQSSLLQFIWFNSTS